MRAILMCCTKTFLELKGVFLWKMLAIFVHLAEWQGVIQPPLLASNFFAAMTSARAGWATLISVHRPTVVVLLIGHSQRRQQHSWDGSGGGSQFVKFQNEQEQVVINPNDIRLCRGSTRNTLSHSECSLFPETIHVTTCKSKVKTFDPLSWSLGPPFVLPKLPELRWRRLPLKKCVLSSPGL